MTRTHWPTWLRSGCVDVALPLLLGSALAVYFWSPLLHGAGFVGGDTYNYFLPLKKFYAEGLRQNEVRLWHPGIGLGVPVLGESQTGVFYPPYLLAYRFLEVPTAYNAVFLAHYVAGFVFAYWFARGFGYAALPSLVGAIVFVYGWFPPRACLEWAIVTGCWMPLAAVLTGRWLETGRFGWGIGLAVVLALQLFAGHFQLAFVTLLAVAAVALLGPTSSLLAWRGAMARRIMVGVWMLFGYALAAPQLLPTWELKLRSERHEGQFATSVTYGRIPLWYFHQLVVGQTLYPQAADLIDRRGGETNMVEAHLYVGVLPLFVLALGGVTWFFRLGRRASGDARRRTWLALVLAGVILAEGSVFQWLAHWPGFGFFRYPGRYGLLAQLGAAALLASVLTRWTRWSLWWGVLVSIAVFAGCVEDFFRVSRQGATESQRVWYVEMVKPPPYDLIEQSPVFQRLGVNDRILAMDGNTLALSPAACVPPYIGLKPLAYQMWSEIPDVFHGKTAADPILVDRLLRAGVTCMLTEVPLPDGWPTTLVWSGFDPFLHRRWGRLPHEPLYLYRFHQPFGRAYFRTPDGVVSDRGRIDELHLFPHHLTIHCQLEEPLQLVIAELAFPGWRVRVDGQEVEPAASQWLRVVELAPGNHVVEWHYQPSSFWRGMLLSASAATIALVVLCARRRQA